MSRNPCVFGVRLALALRTQLLLFIFVSISASYFFIHFLYSFIDEEGNATSEYTPGVFTRGTEVVTTGAGDLPCVVLHRATDCDFGKNDYLWAIPRDQINLNRNLKQNPGY